MKVTAILPDGTRVQTDSPDQVASILGVGGSVLRANGSFYQVMLRGNTFSPASITLDSTPLSSFFGSDALPEPGGSGSPFTNVPGSGSLPVPGPQIPAPPTQGGGAPATDSGFSLFQLAVVAIVAYLIFR